MIYCPKCKRSYEDDNLFCVVDGASLVSLVEKDQNRVVVSWDDDPRGTEIPTQFMSIPQQSGIPQSIPNNSNWLYSVIGGLVVIILFGGGYLVLVVSRENAAEKPRAENSTVASINKPANTSEVAYNSTAGRGDYIAANAQTVSNSVPNLKNDEEIPKSNPEATSSRKGYNGRVIMMNAIIRSSPSVYAPEIYIISFNEPIKIGKSAGGNNPWFRVTTTGGMTGWMHGNTIEFVR